MQFVERLPQRVREWSFIPAWHVPEGDGKQQPSLCSRTCSQPIASLQGRQSPFCLSLEIIMLCAGGRTIVPKEFEAGLDAWAPQCGGNSKPNQRLTWHHRSKGDVSVGRSTSNRRKLTKLGWRTCVECRKVTLQPPSKWPSAPPSYCIEEQWAYQYNKAVTSSRLTWARPLIISISATTSARYSSIGHLPRMLPSHFASSVICLADCIWSAKATKFMRKSLIQVAGAAGVFFWWVWVIQVEIRKL